MRRKKIRVTCIKNMQILMHSVCLVGLMQLSVSLQLSIKDQAWMILDLVRLKLVEVWIQQSNHQELLVTRTLTMMMLTHTTLLARLLLKMNMTQTFLIKLSGTPIVQVTFINLTLVELKTKIMNCG